MTSLADVTPEVLASFVSTVEAMSPGDCWGRVVAVRDGEPLRFHAFRRPDGSWQLTLEDYRQADGGLLDILEWRVVDADYDADGNPTKPCEVVVEEDQPAAIKAGIQLLYDWCGWNTLEDEFWRNPGAGLLWWVWEQ